MGPGWSLGRKVHFNPRGKAGAAAAAQARRLDRVHDLRRRHFVERLLQGAIAAVGAIGVQPRTGFLQNAAQQNGFKLGHIAIPLINRQDAKDAKRREKRGESL